MREFRRTMTRHLSDPSSPSRKPRKRRDPKTIDGRGPDDRLERSLFELGHRFVAGVDEAGRGPLAGPVVAAAVVLDMDRVPEGLDDSKKLSATERERLFDAVLATSTVSVGTASAAEIDRINIRQATFNAMRRAVSGLAQRPCHALIDGRDLPSALGCEGSAVIGGDALSLSIAAASIVAKVTRDRMMRALCIEHPAYGFGTHMGYGTPAHLAAIGAHGPCFHHRRSFAPIRNRVLQTGLA